jgi:protein-L-isoaspartate(D-aspartate) O-methyltransferase
VLEIGTGSGYQAAILSGLVKEVYTIEIIKPLGERAAKTFKKLDYKNIEAKIGDGFEGWAEHAPFDKIIVTCSPQKVPQPLVDQLREGGRIVIPLGERYQQTLSVLAKREGKLTLESREPTFFVPMSGKAEVLRSGGTSGPLTPLVNGGFEQMFERDKPAGWYYLRQAAIEPADASSSGRHIAFKNRVKGYSSQALQALGVDGRKLDELVVELRVKADDVGKGLADEQGGRILVSFFAENRGPVGQQTVGPWTGSFDWRLERARLKVPREAKVAIIAVGLLGATGELQCDDIAIHAADARSAKR